MSPHETGTGKLTGEEAILVALDDGDRDRALSLLMEAYGEPLYRYCRQLLADDGLAEEVHQMSFVHAYESFHRFARRSTLKTWLFSIARHRGMDALKVRRRRWLRFRQVDEMPENADPQGTSEDRLTESDLRHGLAGCLSELTTQVRSALLLRFQEGFSYVEMARICDDRAATLQARVVRALPVLRRCMEGKR